MRLFLRSIWVVLALGLVSGVSALADDDLCAGRVPVVRLVWSEMPDSGSSSSVEMPVGEWRLPVSSSYPDHLTNAWMDFKWTRATETDDWSAAFSFGYRGGGPYGLPYSIQKVLLVWEADGQPRSAIVDLAHECTDPGRGFFPGQRFSAEVKVPGLRDLKNVRNLFLRVWGAQY